MSTVVEDICLGQAVEYALREHYAKKFREPEGILVHPVTCRQWAKEVWGAVAGDHPFVPPVKYRGIQVYRSFEAPKGEFIVF